ncbi:MAG TPA: hypothetical protein VG897_17120 [Terriglobales bacterium]|nr:hypothetical protein [Terriglobales bacterium]
MSASFVPDPRRSWRPFFRAERETVVGCFEEALRRRRKLSGPDRQLLQTHLQNAGVGRPRSSRIADEKLAIGLADLCYRDKDIGNQIIPVVIRLWMESKSDLRSRVEQSLRSNGVEIDVVTSSAHGFVGDWSPDSYREMSRQIHAENLKEPSDAIDLMICCLTGRAPVGSEEAVHEFQAAPIEIDFDEWLSALRDVPETSRLWDTYARFSENASHIYADKRRSATLGPALGDFRAEAGTLQELFGYSDCESWTSTDFDFSVVEQVADDLRIVLANLRVLNRPLSSSYQEQISQFEERRAAGQVVAETYARLSALRNQGSANTGRFTQQTQDPETTADEVAPYPQMRRMSALLSLETAAVTGPSFRSGLESPTGRTSSGWDTSQSVNEDRRGVTAAIDESKLHNQPAAQNAGPSVLWRYPQKSGATRGIATKSTKSVATWQRWEKTALDRKFMIVIGILAMLCVGTIIAIVVITHRISSEHQKTGQTTPTVEESNPAQLATVTLKADGSHFSGTVVRRENNTITMTSSGGFVRTFLESDLSDIKYGPSSSPTAARTPAKSAATAPSAADRVIRFEKGTEFPVRSVGFLDSSSVAAGSILVGMTDADVKNPSGKVVIPAGANVTFGLLEDKKVDGRILLSFELDSADFDGRHYVITSAAGKLGPGITAAFTGAKEGSPEAQARGLNVHLDDQSYMDFRAAMPVTFTLSEK